MAQLPFWLGYGLDCMGFEFRYRKEISLILQNVHTVSKDQPASSSEGAVVPPLGVK
jgi:hypothetical protein